jgi:hypothetical protein
MIVYAILFVWVAKGLPVPGLGIPSLVMAFIVATVYAILIAQFRRRDIAILKCVSWSNSDILLLLVGEVILVSFSAFLIVFQVSVEVLGLAAYFTALNSAFLQSLKDQLAVDAGAMGVTLFYIILLQIPGLVLAQLRAMQIPPMRALREE